MDKPLLSRISLPLLLFASFALLASLVPGGPIETRGFSHIDPVILAAFNVFLTTLGITSVVAAFLVRRDSALAYWASVLIGWCYFLIYVLDLANVFPKSPDPMPPLLLAIEVIGTILSIPLMGLSVFHAKLARGTASGVTTSIGWRTVVALILLSIIGTGVVVFATLAAMRG
ncbi:hypothetical protein [Planctomycetes bacterium K23_9]|uniref:DUF8051 domain-containing protein n=1 Tax=Stieleria marina TaxID=1930275 RepID=A0A517P015_9BACT|nr:hypothetical protein K239x_47280 [Planctomycetes bacterium K23_9]